MHVTGTVLTLLAIHLVTSAAFFQGAPSTPVRPPTFLNGRAAAVRAATKGKTDARKTKIYGQFGKKIIMAVKEGGSASPDANKALRDVISAAKKNNVPVDNINRAIKKATESASGDGFSSSIFEVYASGGASLIISVLTDNPNRAAAEVKNAVNKASKNTAKMAESGSVTYLYERKGRLEFEKGLVDEEKVMDVAIESDVDDFEFVTDTEVNAEGTDVDVVYTSSSDLGSLRDGLVSAGSECNDASLCYKPMAPVECEEDDFELNMNIIDALEELEDVDKVEHNMSN
mmetsp:Transcript_10170/g.20239  ORF Transcript_10170/g.20239 Transcript_10170/m.20239 type:complete len:287 (+) Transcript_10170:444-1304(+)